jgi:hypothetical protein
LFPPVQNPIRVNALALRRMAHRLAFLQQFLENPHLLFADIPLPFFLGLYATLLARAVFGKFSGLVRYPVGYLTSLPKNTDFGQNPCFLLF